MWGKWLNTFSLWLKFLSLGEKNQNVVDFSTIKWRLPFLKTKCLKGEKNKWIDYYYYWQSVCFMIILVTSWWYGCFAKKYCIDIKRSPLLVKVTPLAGRFEQGGSLYRATLIMTRNLGFCGVIWRTALFSLPVRHVMRAVRIYSKQSPKRAGFFFWGGDAKIQKIH